MEERKEQCEKRTLGCKNEIFSVVAIGESMDVWIGGGTKIRGGEGTR